MKRVAGLSPEVENSLVSQKNFTTGEVSALHIVSLLNHITFLLWLFILVKRVLGVPGQFCGSIRQTCLNCNAQIRCIGLPVARAPSSLQNPAPRRNHGAAGTIQKQLVSTTAVAL